MNAFTHPSRCLPPAALLAFAGLLPLALAQPAEGRKFALLIGPRVYESKNLPTTPFGGGDARTVAHSLEKAGFKVVYLNEAEGKVNPKIRPTIANIRASLRELTAGKGKRDQLVFGHFGNGVTIRAGECEVPYLCATDSKLKDPRTMLAVADLIREMDSSKAGNSLLLLDASHPGAGGKVGNPLEAGSIPALPRGFALLFGTTGKQRAHGSDTLGTGHGVFAFTIMEALSGKVRDDDGNVTWNEFADYVQKQVPRLAKEIDPRARQTPTYVANIAGPAPVIARHTGSPRTVTNSIGMKLLRIPAGTFLMGAPKDEPGNQGNEGPRHRVTISRRFYLGEYEVTQEQYRRVMKASPSAFCATGSKKESIGDLETQSFPVEQVTWTEAVEFCDALNALPAEKRAGRKYRLPTEAEWEYACRAGGEELCTWGKSLSSKMANFDGGAPINAPKGPFLNRTCAVGSYKANAWGLHDMHGNVYEWCSDWYAPGYPPGPRTDPTGPRRGTERVIRGGSWIYPAWQCRSARRVGQDPATRGDNVGFRVVLIHP